MNVAMQDFDRDRIGRSRHAVRVRRRTRAFVSDERHALHHLLTVMAHGERVAMEGAGLQARIAPTRDARHFLRRQAWQERFHAAVFAGAAAALPSNAKVSGRDHGAMPSVLSEWRVRSLQALSRGRFAESLLVQQVFLEGLGHVILRQLDTNVQAADDRLSRLGHMIQRQEAQHHAFGLRLLERELSRDPASGTRLDAAGRSLFQQAQDLLAGLSDAFEVLDPDGVDYVAALQAELPRFVPGVAT
jgi:1,2-phenylacetyl-CoA epoxidase catalytic subunit